MSSDDDIQNVRSALMDGKWAEVLKMFKEKRELRTVKITKTGDTMLHIAAAVSERNIDEVESMVDLVCGRKNNGHDDDMSASVDEDGDEMKLVLEAKNEKGNTPLHLAAITPTEISVRMCKKTGSEYPSLIAVRNNAGETPLFLAALHGNRDTFLWLHYLYMGSPGVSPTEFAHCKRDNGDTILHVAIGGGHIDVAIEIVHLYKDHLKEMMSRNKEGLSPLHQLAAQTSAFTSTWLRDSNFILRKMYPKFCGRLLKPKEKNQATTLEELQSWRCNILRKLVLLSPIKRLLPIKELLQKHVWSPQVMKKLLQHATDEDMSRIISKTNAEYLPASLQTENKDKGLESGTVTIETPLMIAAKNGVVEMVNEIIKLFPSRIKDVNTKGKNIVLLAIEYRQWGVYWSLREQKWQTESLFDQVDEEGNNALHLAAMIESNMLSPKEINWFQRVKRSTPPGLLGRYNGKMETPEDIFDKKYMELVKSDAEWAVQASQAFSVVSTLVMTVAFSTRSSVPGGYDGSGYAILRHKPSLFKAFAYCEIFALCFSLVSTYIFLSIPSSLSQSIRSLRNVATKLYLGMIFMFLSVGFLWISFCAGHFFTLDHKEGKTNYGAVLTYIFLSSLVFFNFLYLLPIYAAPVIHRSLPIPASRSKVTPPIEYRKDQEQKDREDHKPRMRAHHNILSY